MLGWGLTPIFALLLDWGLTPIFAFALPVHGLAVVPKAGTLLARDGDTDVRTPYDDCVLIMPTRRPKKGETAVRLGRFVGNGA